MSVYEGGSGSPRRWSHEDTSTTGEPSADLRAPRSVCADIIMQAASRVSSSSIKVIRAAPLNRTQPYGDTEARWAFNCRVVETLPQGERRGFTIKLVSRIQNWTSSFTFSSASFKSEAELHRFICQPPNIWVPSFAPPSPRIKGLEERGKNQYRNWLTCASRLCQVNKFYFPCIYLLGADPCTWGGWSSIQWLERSYGFQLVLIFGRHH